MPIQVRKFNGLLVPINKASFLEELKDVADNDEVWITVKDKLNRTAAQNSLMWDIYTHMQNTTVNECAGKTKDEWHYEMKKKYLVNIYERDDPLGYGSMIESIRQLYKVGLKDRAVKLHQGIVKITSTTTASTTQFTEYLNSIMQYCNEKGIYYRLRDDIFNIAMGVK